MSRTRAGFVALAAVSSIVSIAVIAAPTVPTDVQMPGTQPLDLADPSILLSADECAACHKGVAANADPAYEPWTGWQGSMMSHSARDPLFWSALAVVEQDFNPNADPALRGGAGDFCLRCHLPRGWVEGRSTPTDGSAMAPATDTNGVECIHCHLLVNPDPTVNVTGTVEEQTAPFVANDGADGWYGSGMYVLNSNGTRLGPYLDPPAPHTTLQSTFHRESELCGTCHDVSNPLVGDLAHNHGAQVPLVPGTYSGVPGDPVTGKAAFNNPPQAYGIVERTYSEWKNSAFSTTQVDDFATLPADLQELSGSIRYAYDRSWNPTTMTADYEDGADRYFTCQTCHMAAVTGKGCKQGAAPVRTDLPQHDLTGAGHWVPDAIQWQDAAGTLQFGSGLTADQISAMDAGQVRAVEMLQRSASVTASQLASTVEVRVTNLTGHKLITGYPEGRRLWLNLRWYDGPAGTGNLVAESGGYGPLGNTVQDLDGDDCFPESLLDPDNTTIFDTKPGIDQQWASQLIGFGLPAAKPVKFDRLTGAVVETLGTLAAKSPGSMTDSFHFALNNVQLHDTRIPPYGFTYDAAVTGNMLPVPANQFGDPGPGGTYDYFHESSFAPPVGAKSVVATLYYQQTSWEYVQFLQLANDGLGTLGAEGDNLLDAWCNTGMATPVEVTSVTRTLLAQLPGEPVGIRLDHDGGTGVIDVYYDRACMATDHTLFRGPLQAISSYGYSSATCGTGTSGILSVPAGGGDEFFLVVGNDGTREGSYGRDGSGVERPEDSALPTCDFPQSLAADCD